jgi:hypothetical protein
MAEREASERILNVLRPYAANWSGSLGRGDLVIPHREIPRLIHEILDAVYEAALPAAEVGDAELFAALRETRRLPSLQDQTARLRRAFRIVKR